MWIIGQQKSITWSTEDFYYIDDNDIPQPDSVKLEISHNGGLYWDIIANSTPNTGSFLWTITGPPCGNAVIRYSGVHNAEVTAITSTFLIIMMVPSVRTSGMGITPIGKLPDEIQKHGYIRLHKR